MTVSTRTIKAAAAAFSVSAAAITSEDRTREVSRARFAVYAALRAAGLSLNAAAASVGGRDHTSVMSGLVRCAELRADPAYDARYKLVEAAALGSRRTLAESRDYLEQWPRERARIRLHVALADGDSDALDDAINAVTVATRRLSAMLREVAP